MEIRLCLDGDLPGQTAMMKASKLLEMGGLSYRLVDNQNSTKDPDEILNSDGPNALRTYLSNLLSRVDFALNFYTNSSPLKTSEQKKQLIQQFIPILANIRSAIEYDSYCRKLSTITGYDVESIKKVVVDSKNNSNEKIKTIVDSYDPKNKQLRKLRLAEKELLYQMTNHKNAIEFYEDKVGGFYEDTYRQIANFIVEYSKTHSEVDVSGLINDISASDLKNKEELINELTQIQFENNHPDVCDDKFLKGLLDSICSEKDKLNEQDQMKQMLEGKSPQEQALILNDYNRRKAKKL